MNREEFDSLKLGDMVISPNGDVYFVVHYADSNLPIAVRHETLTAESVAKWMTTRPRYEKPLSDAAAVALSLNGKAISAAVLDTSYSSVAIVFADAERNVNVWGAIRGIGTCEGEFPAEFRLHHRLGLLELPGYLSDENDDGVAELRDYCDAWLSSPSIIIDSEGNLSGTAVALGYKFRQANGRAGVCIDLHLLPKGKS